MSTGEDLNKLSNGQWNSQKEDVLGVNAKKSLEKYNRDIERFNNSIDKVLNGNVSRGYIPFGRTPDVLKKIPKNIHNPIAVFKSTTRENSFLLLILLTEQYELKLDTNKKAPIAVILNVGVKKLKRMNWKLLM